jgi:hypothetical protein
MEHPLLAHLPLDDGQDEHDQEEQDRERRAVAEVVEVNACW